jgi:Mn-dependent DtxR family transcriptional regulator
MDAETALHRLKISREELNNIIRKLSQMEMLQYVDFNTVELTDVGIGYLSKKDKNKQ